METADGGGFFDSTNLVDELDLSGWPGGTWTSSTPNLPSPNRQANQAGFYGGGNIWSVGGIDGSTFTFFSDVFARPSCAGGGGGPCSLGPWNIVANYPFTGESVSVSTDGTFAYGAGGFDPNIGPTNSFNQYDPVGNTWSPLPNIPGAFYDAPSVYVPGTNSIYVFGGLDANFLPSNVVQIFDITSGTWTTGTPMPGARYFAGAVYYSGNGLVYVCGGFDENFLETTTSWEYDPVANTWNTSRAPMPVAMGGMGYSIVGQNMYLAGTWNGGLGSMLHYRYDIVADAWTQMADVPVNIYRPASASIGTNTYLVGGGDPFVAPRASPKARKLASTRAPATSFNTTYVYDTVADTWSSGPNTNVAHSFTGGTAIGNSLLVVTGFDGGGDTNTVEKSDCGARTLRQRPR